MSSSQNFASDRRSSHITAQDAHQTENPTATAAADSSTLNYKSVLDAELELLKKQSEAAIINQNEKLYQIFSSWLAMELFSTQKVKNNNNNQRQSICPHSYGQLSERQGRCAITMEV